MGGANSYLGGRSNEAFSPDPYLTGMLASVGIKAQQSAGIITGVRHFVLYEQETNRTASSGGGSAMGSGSAPSGTGNSTSSMNGTMFSARDTSTTSSSTVYSSNADDKTLHELYLFPWGDAINSGAMVVMCAMNQVNDTHSCENNELLSGKLKAELGFPGFVWPDEEAQFTSYGSANAGLDYSGLSGDLWTQTTLSEGIANGSLSQARLDDMATRAVLPYYAVGLDTVTLPTLAGVTEYRDVRGNHSKIIRQVGGEAIALLKNNVTSGGGLPLSAPRKIALFGSHAGPAQAGPNYAFGVTGTSSNIFEGHLITGGGSGQGSAPYIVTPFQSITQHAIDDNSMIWYIMNNSKSS